MSIYRERLHRPDDIHATRRVVDMPRAGPTASASEDRYRHLRRGAPVDKLLPATVAWAERLPSDLRPVALLGRYARIANLVAATWGDSRAFEAYMDSLLTDKRGNRQGFPPEVARELATLALARTRFPSNARFR
jgi:hypothetical protein